MKIPDHVLEKAKEYAKLLAIERSYRGLVNNYDLCTFCGSLTWCSSSGEYKNPETTEINISTEWGACGNCSSFRNRFPDVFNFITKVVAFQRHWFTKDE